jgi:hypothetical protein
VPVTDPKYPLLVKIEPEPVSENLPVPNARENAPLRVSVVVTVAVKLLRLKVPRVGVRVKLPTVKLSCKVKVVALLSLVIVPLKAIPLLVILWAAVPLKASVVLPVIVSPVPFVQLPKNDWLVEKLIVAALVLVPALKVPKSQLPSSVIVPIAPVLSSTIVSWASGKLLAAGVPPEAVAHPVADTDCVPAKFQYTVFAVAKVILVLPPALPSRVPDQVAAPAPVIFLKSTSVRETVAAEKDVTDAAITLSRYVAFAPAVAVKFPLTVTPEPISNVPLPVAARAATVKDPRVTAVPAPLLSVAETKAVLPIVKLGIVLAPVTIESVAAFAFIVDVPPLNVSPVAAKFIGVAPVSVTDDAFKVITLVLDPVDTKLSAVTL